jgi:DNA-binding transcriptional ArsR family regulator
MVDEKFVVFSMKEEKAKEIARVIQSKKAKAILDLLAEGRRTPSEISKELSFPMSTVQFNLDLLRAAGLIKATAKRYSKKGREIKYYEPAKKVIVLAPETAKQGIIEMLGDKVILPIITIISLATGLLFGFKKIVQTTATEFAGAPAMEGAKTLSLLEVGPSASFDLGVVILITALVFGILAGIYLAYKSRK